MITLRNFLLSKMQTEIVPGHVDLACGREVDSFLRLSEAREQWLREHNYIDIQYTDDEFGAAAKEFGVIQHAYPGDAGMDLPIVLSGEERSVGVILRPDERRMMHTGMMTAFPKGYWGFIIHRSSTEFKQHLRVVEGVIDDYRGELLVHAHNSNQREQIVIEHGQKLGQLIIIKTASFKARVVEELRPSERGACGFGSSGLKASA
jgi:dUTP pyrophosphatase